MRRKKLREIRYGIYRVGLCIKREYELTLAIRYATLAKVG